MILSIRGKILLDNSSNDEYFEKQKTPSTIFKFQLVVVGKSGSVLFHVIPAKAGIQSRSERDFKRLQILWTPVFTGETTRK
jgi:hypothetical protein